MNKELMASWPVDLMTGQTMIPPGEFTTLEKNPHAASADMHNFPVLRGLFDSKHFDLGPELPGNIRWGYLNLANALFFRLQLGPNMLFWLANPADPEVWKVLDIWAATGRIVLAAEFADEPPLIVSQDFNMSTAFRANRRFLGDSKRTADFIAEARHVIVLNELAPVATSDIEEYPNLQHVQACMVRTKVTHGVTILGNEVTQESSEHVAELFAALTKAAESITSMLQSERTRR